MKFKVNQIFVTALSGLAVLSASSLGYTAESDCKATTVQFKKDSYSANYQGKIKGWQCVSYQFSAKKGQTLTVTISTKGYAEAELYDNYDFIQDEPYTLPKTGKYDIRVLHPKAAAIKNKTSSYSIKIEIK